MTQSEEFDAKNWLRVNAAGGESLDIVYRALKDVELPEVSIAEHGAYAAIKEGDRILVRGPQSTLILPSLESKQAFMQQIATLSRHRLEGKGN